MAATPEGPVQRRCRQSLRNRFAALFAVPPDWLSGETDALTYVLSADATIIALPFPEPEREERRHVRTRLSLFRGDGRANPGLQLALERLLVQADRALARDEAQAAFGAGGDLAAKAYARPYGFFLVAASAEVGLDLIRPLPPIDRADDLRISAARHAAEVLRPWFEDQGGYPNWEHLHQRVLDQTTERDRRAMLGVLEDLGREDLFAIYAWHRATTAQGSGPKATDESRTKEEPR
jgi:hypothetical protein